MSEEKRIIDNLDVIAPNLKKQLTINYFSEKLSSLTNAAFRVFFNGILTAMYPDVMMPINQKNSLAAFQRLYSEYADTLLPILYQSSDEVLHTIACPVKYPSQMGAQIFCGTDSPTQCIVDTLSGRARMFTAGLLSDSKFMNNNAIRSAVTGSGINPDPSHEELISSAPSHSKPILESVTNMKPFDLNNREAEPCLSVEERINAATDSYFAETGQQQNNGTSIGSNRSNPELQLQESLKLNREIIGAGQILNFLLAEIFHKPEAARKVSLGFSILAKIHMTSIEAATLGPLATAGVFFEVATMLSRLLSGPERSIVEQLAPYFDQVYKILEVIITQLEVIQATNIQILKALYSLWEEIKSMRFEFRLKLAEIARQIDQLKENILVNESEKINDKMALTVNTLQAISGMANFPSPDHQLTYDINLAALYTIATNYAYRSSISGYDQDARDGSDLLSVVEEHGETRSSFGLIKYIALSIGIQLNLDRVPNMHIWSASVLRFLQFRSLAPSFQNSFYNKAIKNLWKRCKEICDTMRLLGNPTAIKLAFRNYTKSLLNFVTAFGRTIADLRDSDGFPLLPISLQKTNILQGHAPSLITNFIQFYTSHLDDSYYMPSKGNPIDIALQSGFLAQSPNENIGVASQCRYRFTVGILTSLTIRVIGTGPNLVCYRDNNNNATWRDAVKSHLRSHNIAFEQLRLPKFVNTDLSITDASNRRINHLTFPEFVHYTHLIYRETRKHEKLNDGPGVTRALIKQSLLHEISELDRHVAAFRTTCKLFRMSNPTGRCISEHDAKTMAPNSEVHINQVYGIMNTHFNESVRYIGYAASRRGNTKYDYGKLVIETPVGNMQIGEEILLDADHYQPSPYTRIFVVYAAIYDSQVLPDLSETTKFNESIESVKSMLTTMMDIYEIPYEPYEPKSLPTDLPIPSFADTSSSVNGTHADTSRPVETNANLTSPTPAPSNFWDTSRRNPMAPHMDEFNRRIAHVRARGNYAN